ncbi:exodeoxyribonuclease VII small subunit [Vampirovibrio sp.]|uniref:exodeoxyribonuclease VII small subunit n=1 Tax=Vampirovibrio sp. TaxID=2717857 RepID=UPI00359362F7
MTQSLPTFSESSQALEDIVDRFRAESLPLEEALGLFEQGVGHIKVCQTKLTEARGKVEELVKTLQEDGESVTRPFEA